MPLLIANLARTTTTFGGLPVADRSRNASPRRWWIAVAVLIGLAGCGQDGPERGAVHGKVTLDGQPVEEGSIAFVPSGTNAGPAAGGTISGGEFSISEDAGPILGTNLVQIRWSRKTGKKVPAGSPAPAGTMVEEIVEAIPAKYNSQSTLEKQIEAGDNEINFELTSK